MPKQTKSAKLKQAKVTIDKAVGDYSKHPFFIRKANESKQLLKKVGLPKKTINTD